MTLAFGLNTKLFYNIRKMVLGKNFIEILNWNRYYVPIPPIGKCIFPCVKERRKRFPLPIAKMKK